MVGHFLVLWTALVFRSVLSCAAIRAARVALPGASVELFVPSRRAPGGCQSCSPSQQIGLSCPVGPGGSLYPALGARTLGSSSSEQRNEAEMKAASSAPDGWSREGQGSSAGKLTGTPSQTRGDIYGQQGPGPQTC